MKTWFSEKIHVTVKPKVNKRKEVQTINNETRNEKGANT